MTSRIGLLSLADRLISDFTRKLSGDPLDGLSQQVTQLKSRLYADEKLSPGELQQLETKMQQVQSSFSSYAARQGYPVGQTRPASPESFKLYREQQEISFEWFAGKDLRSGAVGQLNQALEAGDPKQVDSLVHKMALDIEASPSEAVAKDKVRLLRASLATLDDRGQQTAVLSSLRTRLDSLQQDFPAAKPAVLTPAAFDSVANFKTEISEQKLNLPDSIRGTDKIMPNRPIPGWEAETARATHAAFDQMDQGGQLFLDKIPPGAGTAEVAVKLDLNFGADGPPSVSDPAATKATCLELLERAEAKGKSIHLTVGDSIGGENAPLGRTTPDVERDTGNYAMALKAGLEFAAKKGEPGAAASLAKVNAAEARGVYFGSKDDKVSTPADLAAAEQAAARYVTVVDFDKAGFDPVEPNLGPMGMAAWGTNEFNIAKPWAEADYRVHVARGTSTHLLAGWTGSVKGLIGLHAFGLRPADQGMKKLGVDPVQLLPVLAGAGGFAEFMAGRTGLTGLAASLLALGNPELSKLYDSALTKWADLSKRGPAWTAYQADVQALAGKLRQMSAQGASRVQLQDAMRWGMRGALDHADQLSPGFRQEAFDAATDGTRAFERVAYNFRELAPPEMRDEQMGQRIGLLTQLPYQSDLVVKSQAKMGTGGGPDSYDHVRDVGDLIVGTNDAATDAAAWKASGQPGNLWAENDPLYASLAFGGGPMHDDEIVRLNR